MKTKDFRQKNLVFCDVETTGLNPEIHEIIEVACIVVDGKSLKEITSFEAKVKPQRIERAEKEALQINGYSPEKWKEALEPKAALMQVANISPNGILTGWNVSFDWSFLMHSFDRYAIIPKLDYQKIDVPSIAYSELYKKELFVSLALRNVAPLFGIKLGAVHSAMEDTRATYEIFKKVMGMKIEQASLGI